MAKKLQRHFLTGEWQEVDMESESGIVRYRTGPVEHKTGNVWRKGWKSIALACHPGAVTDMNDRLKECGVDGAHYDKSGILHASDRSSRAAAYALRGCYDQQGGYLEDRYSALIGA